MRRVHLAALTAIVVIGAVATGCQAAGLGGDATRPVAPTTARAPAPPLSAAPLNGGPRVTLASHRGKPVVLNFWASWCAPCEDEAPLLRQIAAEQMPKGVAFVGVNAKDTTDGATAFIARYRLGYPQVRGGSTADTYGVSQFPETFVIDRQGRTVAWFPGEVEPDALRAAIERASA